MISSIVLSALTIVCPIWSCWLALKMPSLSSVRICNFLLAFLVDWSFLPLIIVWNILDVYRSLYELFYSYVRFALNSPNNYWLWSHLYGYCGIAELAFLFVSVHHASWCFVAYHDNYCIFYIFQTLHVVMIRMLCVTHLCLDKAKKVIIKSIWRDKNLLELKHF